MHRKKLKDFLAQEVLELKLGAQVMLIKNLDEKLVNGSMGRVIEFADSGMPVVEFVILGGKVGTKATKLHVEIMRETWDIEAPGEGTIASRTQVPLVLAYAM